MKNAFYSVDLAKELETDQNHLKLSVFANKFSKYFKKSEKSHKKTVKKKINKKKKKKAHIGTNTYMTDLGRMCA